MVTTPLFRHGLIVATPGAVEALNASHQSPYEFLHRHVRGDWGELDPADVVENDLSVKEGSRILSAYRTKLKVKIWVITEADRSSTCLLLPDEY